MYIYVYSNVTESMCDIFIPPPNSVQLLGDRSSEMQLCHLMRASSALVLFVLITSTPRMRASPLVPAVLIFGDSIVDTGNNNVLITTSRCNFPPYGRDFIQHVATGRFSNGKVPPDLIASQLGVKEFVPAYLDPELTDENLLTGVSFASGSAGYDNLTAEIPRVFSLWDQLEMCKDYKRKLESIAGEEKAASIIRESVYLIFSGSNDIMATYFVSGARARSYDLPSYLNFLVDAASSFLKELYQLGARKIAVAGAPPIGCVPMSRTLKGGITRDCVDIFNQASIQFNLELTKEIERSNANLPGSNIVYLDVYSKLLDMIQNPSHYGFSISTRGCCGTGEVEASVFCNYMSPFTCTDTEDYLFWDSFHPTEKAFKIIIASIADSLHSLL